MPARASPVIAGQYAAVARRSRLVVQALWSTCSQTVERRIRTHDVRHSIVVTFDTLYPLQLALISSAGGGESESQLSKSWIQALRLNPLSIRERYFATATSTSACAALRGPRPYELTSSSIVLGSIRARQFQIRVIREMGSCRASPSSRPFVLSTRREWSAISAFVKIAGPIERLTSRRVAPNSTRLARLSARASSAPKAYRTHADPQVLSSAHDF